MFNVVAMIKNKYGSYYQAVQGLKSYKGESRNISYQHVDKADSAFNRDEGVKVQRLYNCYQEASLFELNTSDVAYKCKHYNTPLSLGDRASGKLGNAGDLGLGEMILLFTPVPLLLLCFCLSCK